MVWVLTSQVIVGVFSNSGIQAQVLFVISKGKAIGQDWKVTSITLPKGSYKGKNKFSSVTWTCVTFNEIFVVTLKVTSVQFKFSLVLTVYTSMNYPTMSVLSHLC